MRALAAPDRPVIAHPGGPEPGAGLPEERRILERCAREIALEAGAGARVVEIGGREPGAADLLAAAIAALASPPRRRARRRVLFLSGRRTSAMSEAQLGATLRRIRDRSAADALLVVGAANANAGSLARFGRLAASASWEPRQLWSDGPAAFALHVLARRAAGIEEAHM